MTDQWDKYVEAAAVSLDPAAFDKTIENHDGYVREFRRDRATELARGVLAVVGPLIAEDTRERIVEAAARAVEREWATDVLGKLRELHGAKPVPQPSHFTTWCDECQCSWPCHTAAILDGAS